MQGEALSTQSPRNKLGVGVAAVYTRDPSCSEVETTMSMRSLAGWPT